jgi:hypothetical protein
MSEAPAEGGCLCGAVRYRFSGAPTATSNCHCRSCRLAAGAQAVAWVVIPRSVFMFTRGEPRRYRSSPAVVRTFCGTCGTPLTYEHDRRPETIDIQTGTLDRPERFPPSKEVWVDERIAWVQLDDRRPHFPRSSLKSES